MIVAFHKLPHPLRDGDLLFYDAAATQETLAAAGRGSAVAREAAGATAPPGEDEVRALERRLRRRLQGQSRAAGGRALWWWLLGPALALLWINFAEAIALLFAWLPPLAVLIGTLGAVAGGLVLATIVALLPLAWAWRRALAHRREAQRYGRLARVLGTRRYREAPLTAYADPALAGFLETASASIAGLRTLAPALIDKGADGAGEAAHLAKALYRLAARYRLPDVAGAYHALYSRFDAAEQRALKLERAGGGVFVERKAAGELQRARRQVAAQLAAYSATGAAPAHTFAPFLGLLAGSGALVAALLLTGTFWVEPDQAVIVDPLSSRVVRLANALGLTAPASSAGLSGDATEIVRRPGFNWGWPRPFAARHAVTLGEQLVPLRAVFRRTGPDTYDVLAVDLRFRIADLDRWAQGDRDGNGVARLSAQLSGFLQDVVQRARGEARQALAQQNPPLAGDPAQLAARADQLIESRLNEIVRAFVGAVSSDDSVRAAGVQFGREFAVRLVQGVPASAIPGVSEEP